VTTREHFFNDYRKQITRRWFFKECGVGLGAIALGSLLSEGRLSAADKIAGSNPLAPRQPHFGAKAKRVIFLFMHGGPSSVDTFDPKPRLTLDDGKPLPIKRPLAFAGGTPGPLMKNARFTAISSVSTKAPQYGWSSPSSPSMFGFPM